MSLLSWSPFLPLEREMQSMLRRFEDLLDDTTRRMPWRPATDMFHDEDSLVVKIELPGVAAADVEISVEEGMLHVHGERHDEHEEQREGGYLKERFYGRFDRQFMLPEGVDPNEIEASFADGVLTVRVPVPTPLEPSVRKIAIKAPRED